jgi:hypothetical protein
MLGNGVKVKVKVSKSMVEEGFIPSSIIPQVLKKVEGYHKRVYVTDMEGRDVYVEPVVGNNTVLGFYCELDPPNFSHISLIFSVSEDEVYGKRI